MWANHEIVELVEWLKEYNSTIPENRKAGFYGLDVYSLWDSMRAIIDYLRKIDGDLIKTALKAYECFEPYHEDIEEYQGLPLLYPLLVSMRSSSYSQKYKKSSLNTSMMDGKQVSISNKMHSWQKMPRSITVL
jgi:hypothetical protein